jgi:hypothetical protein
MDNTSIVQHWKLVFYILDISKISKISIVYSCLFFTNFFDIVYIFCYDTKVLIVLVKKQMERVKCLIRSYYTLR